MLAENIQVLSAAVIRILRPLVLILLRHGVSYGTFAELTKWVYVDVALKEFGIPRRKQSTSRVSILTGLSRKEVMRVRRLSRPTDRESAERFLELLARPSVGHDKVVVVGPRWAVGQREGATSHPEVAMVSAWFSDSLRGLQRPGSDSEIRSRAHSGQSDGHQNNVTGNSSKARSFDTSGIPSRVLWDARSRSKGSLCTFLKPPARSAWALEIESSVASAVRRWSE